MKLSQNWSMLLLVSVVLAVLVCTEARKRGANKSVCKYNKKGKEAECDTTTNTKAITFTLKKGDANTCAPTMVKQKPCNGTKKSKGNKDCKYDKQNASWSECDEATGKKKKTMPLKEGSSADCEPTQTKMKNCDKNKKMKPKKACMYEKQPWSVCDVETKQKQRDMILIKGNSTQCVPKKTITKACKKTCRYDRSGWSACDKLTRQKQRQLTPKSNSIPQCTPTVETRPCYVRAELTAAKPHKCRYMPSTWSECDPRSNTMTMVMTSKTRDPVCQKYKKLSRKCKAACKFRRGEWSECDETSQLMTRVDSLVSGSPKQCDESRQITKKCRRKCKYTFGEWGECDPVTNHRTRVKKLVDGGDQTKCLPEDIVTKPCEKKNGRERCFYGAWGEFGPCTNGVVTKNRQVLQGGVECERKAVITQACTKTPGS